MVTLTDTHSHIYAKAFDTDRTQMLENAKRQGISHILMPNIDLESIPGMMDLARDFPSLCLPMMGLHPCSVDENWESTLDEILHEFRTHQFIAVGEIGIDLYWDKTTLSIQQKAFRRQVEFAIEQKLPIAIHTRSATAETVEILREYRGTDLTGVFHCFSESFEFANEIADLGFYFGIGGVLTFKNSGLAEAVKHLPADRMILETDAPYLAPVPFRGKRNEPAYVWHVAKMLAEILGMGFSDLAVKTTENADRLFRISDFTQKTTGENL